MSSLGEFVAAFCGACVLLGALFTLVPQGALSKPVKYLFCLLYLCCILSCATGLEYFIPDITAYDYTPSVSEENAEASAELIIAQALSNSGIEFSEIKVFTDISQEGSITFNEVRIYTSAAPDTVREILGYPEEYEVTVINE